MFKKINKKLDIKKLKLIQMTDYKDIQKLHIKN